MRYEDTSHTGAFVQGSEPDARNDADAIAAGSNAPATGNVITGEGTQTGPSGSDYGPGAHITTIAGAGGEDSSFAGGKLSVSGEFGRLSIDAEGNYSYQAKPNTPENSVDRFTYTLADSQGAADTATLMIEIGKTPAVIKANAQQVVPGPDGVVILPPGVELSDVHIVGRNLVIDLPDGGQMVIVDGAVFVPQLVLGGVEVPATNLAALLVGQEIAPAAGEGPPQSSGGNFAVPPPPLDPGVPLGDLIPPTEYGYQPPEVKEVFDLIDEEPEIFIQPDGQPAAVNASDTVDEKGLPSRNEGEPEGSGEEAAAGADGDPSEATGGTIVIDSPDGVDSLTITGDDGIPHEVFVGLEVHGAYGTLTITGQVGSNYTYTYVLDDNIDHSDGAPDQDDFSVTLTDNDGDTATATLTIDIIDDVPTARPDTDFIAAGEYGPVTGNVITDDDAGDHDVSGTDSDTDNGRDTVGADDASLTNVTGFGSTEATEGGWVVQGHYGVLTINEDGSYSYLRNQGSPGGVDDVFNYTLTDGDGDTSVTTLTISIADTPPTIDVPVAGEDGTLVDEQGLPTRNGGEPAGSGEIADGDGADNDDTSETTTGTVNFTPGDGPAVIRIDGVVVTGINQTFAGEHGTLTITGITGTSVSYSYTLSDNTSGDATFDDFSFSVTDQDNDVASSTLTINIVDDVPTAADDTDTVASGTYGPETGNVITGVGTTSGDAGADVVGADDSEVSGLASVNVPANVDNNAAGGFVVNGQYGVLTLQADGSYSYVRNAGTPGGVSDVFDYTITDGDGDTSIATLTINIADARPETAPNAVVALDDDTFPGGNPGGTGDDDPDTANLTGTLSGSGGDGPLTWSMISFTSPGGTFSASLVDPTLLEIRQSGTLVFTITLNNSTGEYSVTQVATIDHTAGGDENNFSFTLGYRIADVDGDQAFGTLSINADDDTPLAFNDTDTLSGGATSADGNVITGLGTVEGAANADKPGADGFDTITQLSGSGSSDSDATGGFTAIGTYGTLQMSANGSYTYTRTNGDPLTGTDTFTYTYKDGDGDLASATLTLNISDSAPLLGTPAIAQLDDETFTGGNPGGTDDANPNTANLVGDLAGSAGDGDLDYAFTGSNTLPAGFSASVNPAGTIMQISQAGVGVVMTITLDLETGHYTVAQNLPMDHPTPGLSEEDLTFGIGVKVVDGDGDSATNTLTIKVDDDTPLANNDSDNITSGGTSASGNVITGVGTNEGAANADKPGADGYDTITGVSGAVTSDTNATGGFTSQGNYGTLQMAADGSYTYTRADGSPGDVSDVFTYTYKDGDGDLASATLTINIGDAAPLLGTPAIAQLDDETFTGGNPGGTDDANPNTANLSGDLAGSGGDGTLTYAFTGLDTLPATFSIDASSTPTSLKIAQAGVGIVMTITLDLNTGHYTITQNLPMDHPTAGVSEEDLTFGIGVKTVDEDGDSAINTLTIKVDDDTPLANNDSDTVAGGSATGNVITGSGTTEGTGNADHPGADGFDSITKLQGSGGTDTDPTGGFTVSGTYGSLQMAADGTYTYTRTDGLGGGQSEVFTYTYKDGDGDLASATLTINIPDATPLLGTPAIAQSDDEIFANGIAGGTDDANPNTANLVGDLAGSGGDGDLDYAFTGTNTLPTGFSASVNPAGTIMQISQAGVGVVLTITLDLETGHYTIAQNQPMDHPTAGLSEEDLQFLVGVKVVDVDGDSAVNTLTINVDDDTPTAVHAAAITSGLENGGGDSASANLDGGAGGNSILVDNFGADGGKVIFTAASQTYLENLDLKHAGVELTYVISNGGQTITGSAGGTTVITIELQPGGSNNYTVTMNDSIDTLVTTVFDDVSFDFVGGNGSWAGFTSGTDGDNINDLLLTPMVNGAYGSTMNTNANEGGVGSGNSVAFGEGVRIDSVSDLHASPAPTPSGDYGIAGNRNHVFGEHENVIGLSGLLSTVNGAKGSTVDVNLIARDETPATDVDDQVGDGAINEITIVTITHGGITGTVLKSGGASQDVVVDGITYHVNFGATDATVLGAVVDTRIGAQVADGGYDSLEFRNVTSPDNTFKIGAFAALSTSAGPLDLAVPISVVDGDGDTVTSGTLPIHISGSDELPLLAQQSSLAAPAEDDTSSFSSLLASDSQDQQLQKTAANSNTTLLAAAVAASGLAGTQAAASPGNSDFGHQHQMADTSNFASKVASLVVDSGEEGRAILSNEMKVAANDEPQTLQSSHGTEDFSSSVQGLDNAPAHLPADLGAFFGAVDHGPAVDAAAAGPVAPAVAMISADALKAAGVDGTAKHGGAVDKVVADALGHDAPPTVDGLLQALGGGQVAAISHVASPAADAVPAWDMGSHGAFVPGADMMFKMGAEMLHHDAVQPVVNG